jgi:hypothetical protein
LPQSFSLLSSYSEISKSLRHFRRVDFILPISIDFRFLEMASAPKTKILPHQGAGVPVTMKEYPGTIHGFFGHGFMVDDAYELRRWLSEQIVKAVQ